MSELPPNLSWLFARQRFGVRPGLARVRALLARLGNPERAFEAVLVGGTNGKGSTASTLASALGAAGARVGRFTSPHLSRVGERFVISGAELPTSRLEHALAALRPAAEREEATFFEILTALACALFAEAGVRRAVFEVGLGGRFDATNALEPVLSIVTGVALDHTEVLGDTVAAIARDKAQIFRAGRPALTGATGEALAVVRREAAAIGAPLTVLGEALAVEVRSSGWRGLELTLRWPDHDLELATPLIGRHQARNVALAAAAARLLGAEDEAIRQGAAATRWPGRLEPVRYRGRTVLLDGAHNPAAAEALAAALRELGAEGLTLVFGASQEKDVAGILAPLLPMAARVIFTRARLSPRASPPAALRRHAPRAAVREDWQEALELALAETPPEAPLLVAGSLYLVGEVRPHLLGEPLEGLERWQ